MKGAAVYRKGDVWYFCPFSRTTAGFWVGCEPLLRVQEADSQAAKGEAALAALNASQEAAATPPPEADLTAPLLRLAQVKSWSAFMKNACSLELEAKGAQMTIIPCRNLGPKGGFESIPENTLHVPFDSSAERVGAAMEKAFAECE